MLGLRQHKQTVEAVNPIRVFERDRWKCQLCKRATPRKLRGTLDDRAPELDHIKPISKGGEHSYRNTQCACRACNLAKSDRPMGQMLLIG
ncbi:MAG: HNH endonuclease [Desulfuromonadaceae bacterium]